MNFDFEPLRPYCDKEVPEAMVRVRKSPEFNKVLEWVFDDLTPEQLYSKIEGIQSVKDFQLQLMHIGIRKIVDRTSNGLTFEGFENLTKSSPNLFIGNHRDIFLDSALLQILLVEHDLDTTQITFGSNLMKGVMVDVGKINKMFTVYREGDRRQMYENSLRLSSYIKKVITEQKESIWIAQRAGGTKDGNDITHTGVLKMLAQSGNNDFVKTFTEINITPVVISYEFEPCDYLKVQELYTLNRDGKYEKDPTEDLNSIVKGVIEQKGKLHLAITPPITNKELVDIDLKGQNYNDKIKLLTELVDARIYDHYKLWPSNYLAHDILNNTSEFSEYYTQEYKEDFEKMINNKLAKLEGKRDQLETMLLEIYANPLVNVSKQKEPLQA